MIILQQVSFYSHDHLTIRIILELGSYYSYYRLTIVVHTNKLHVYQQINSVYSCFCKILFATHVYNSLYGIVFTCVVLCVYVLLHVYIVTCVCCNIYVSTYCGMYVFCLLCHEYVLIHHV